MKLKKRRKQEKYITGPEVMETLVSFVAGSLVIKSSQQYNHAYQSVRVWLLGTCFSRFLSFFLKSPILCYLFHKFVSQRQRYSCLCFFVVVNQLSVPPVPQFIVYFYLSLFVRVNKISPCPVCPAVLGAPKLLRAPTVKKIASP